MTDDEVGVPAGVVIAALILGVMAFVGLLLAACSAFALFISNTPLIPRIPSVRLLAAGLDGLIIALAILAAFTIVGLFRLKLWARYSITLLGLLDLVVFALMAAGVLFGRAKLEMSGMQIPGHPGVTLGDIMVGLAAIYAILALIGVWWMIYFNLGRLRSIFADANSRLTP
ncbi:MAG TPA: hypothetical protein VFW25_03940 [Silvibacterium sp.]|nr:hypothetical protein [Silvibacterium sp.]